MIARASKLFVVVGLVSLLGAARAEAQSNPATCTNDIDCIATPQCGGDVCDWNTTPHTCKPAGQGPKGADGWCTTDEDCKCFALGARCVSAIYCTFTKPSDAPDAGMSTGTGGTTGGASGGGGGCSVAGVTAPGLGGLLLAGALFAAGVRRRRRSRASQ